jgi:hypothetical protein
MEIRLYRFVWIVVSENREPGRGRLNTILALYDFPIL